MLDFIVSFINEIRSYFVPERLTYKVVGECKKCGKCCNHMYSYDEYTEKEFKFMQLLFPAYRRFYIKGRDEDGKLIFTCKLVSPEGLCTVYNKRLAMCRRYPAKQIRFYAKMPEGCGYTVIKKDFKDYLK